MEQASNTAKINVDPNEVAKFERIANQWWDTEGQFKPLHQMNPIRANFIDLHSPVAAKQLLDVGCGGGLLSEAMAHRGASVTAIDMGEEPLNVARLHAQQSRLKIVYQRATAEQFAAQNAAQFDIVTCLEMLEHVPDPESVIQACATLVKPGGAVYFSTINRNLKSYAMAVLAAEYILQWVPRGTHDYQKFIRPSELACWGRNSGLQLQTLAGIVYNPFTATFAINKKDADCNYIMHFKRPQD